MDTIGFAAIVSILILFSLVSRRLERLPLTGPMIFSACGFALVAGGVSELRVEDRFVHGLAEATLILVLFSDAARIELRSVRRDHDIPLRMLLIGMPLTIGVGTLIGVVLPLQLGIWEAALLAAILAPTDAALGQPVVVSPRVPPRVRQALNVESGLNDGIALPVVLLLASVASAGYGAESDRNWLVFGLMQVTLGPAAGAAIGWVGASLIDRAVTTGWMTESYEGPAVLATAFLAFATAELTGGNGFIAAFVAGLIFGNRARGRCRFLFEFAEAEGQLLILLTFLIFGAGLLSEVPGQAGWVVVGYAVLSLTIVRLLPVAVALVGLRLRIPTIMFLGWFGPRGLASILFLLFIVEETPLPGSETIRLVVTVTVGLSILLHGMTAAPVAERYGLSMKGEPQTAEHRAVTEMPTRAGAARRHG